MKLFYLKFCSLLLCLMIGASNVWAGEINLNTTNLGLTSTTYNTSFSKTVGNVTFASDNIGKNSSGVAIKSKGALWNSTAMPNVIQSIAFTSLKFSSSSSASCTIYGATSAGEKTEELGTITSDGATTIDFSGKKYTYFYLDNTGSRALYFECTIKYADANASAYTVTFNAGSNGECSVNSIKESAANAGVTLPSCTSIDDDYDFVGWASTSGASKADAGTAGDKYYPKEDVTLYAIYKNNNTKTAKFDLSANKYEWGATTDGNVYFDGSTYTPAVEGDITLSVYGNVRMWGTTESSLRLYGNNVGSSPNIYTFGKGSITLKAAENYLITSVKFEGTNLTFNPSVGTYTNPTWVGEASEVTFEKGSNTPQIKSITVSYEKASAPTPQTLTLSAELNGYYYATFSSENAVEFENDVVYTVSASGETLNITPVASKQVPANTGVLIKSENNVENYFVIDSADELNGNMLKAASTPMEGDYSFYKLAYDNYSEKSGLGFYYGEEDGAAFSCKAGTAYLAVPASAGVKSFVFADDATAIKSVAVPTVDANAPVYNMAGQRVSANTKGIVFQNGKKYFNK